MGMSGGCVTLTLADPTRGDASPLGNWDCGRGRCKPPAFARVRRKGSIAGRLLVAVLKEARQCALSWVGGHRRRASGKLAERNQTPLVAP